MPIRIMGYDYAAYREMIDHDIQVNPVITVVLNFTDKRWDAPKSLHELMQVSEEMSAYVQDYAIRVFDVAFLEDEVIEQFTSDFKHIARFFKMKRLGRNKEATADDKTPIRHVEAVLDMFRVFSKDNRYAEVYTAELQEKIKRGEEVFMCSVIDYYEQCGIEKGIEKGMEKAVCSLVTKGLLRIEDAAAELGVTVEELEEKLKTLPK